MDLKHLKADLKHKTDKDPSSYYAVSVLEENDFHRENCVKCSKFFWTASDSSLCGDPECSGSYTFIGDPPTKNKLDFIQVWKNFSKFFNKAGYESINRYPIVARWRDDVYWNNASIYNFQPHVVSGEVEPPANPLIVPQLCARFNDIDNVGVTGRHYTSFVMIGQHAFTPPDKFEQDKYFRDIYDWLVKGIGIAPHELKFHEDQWGGGGNLGPCMEWFARGLELGNQVYINYEYGDYGVRDLDLKVLDMGTGQERYSWLSHGTDTSYEANYPTAVKQLYKVSGVKPDRTLLSRFLPYSGLLNSEEVSSIDKAWEGIAKHLDVDTKVLREEIAPLTSLYAIGDHTRTLLISINDGAIPSNVGGCYNLRVILRRALSFIDNYDWNLDLSDICETHAKYLKPQYPELLENLESVREILDYEKSKYISTRKKSKQTVMQAIKKGVSDSVLIGLYDSHGVSPEYVKELAAEDGKTVKVPENFYALVAERHPEVEKKAKPKKADVSGIAETDMLYYKHFNRKFKFDAKVLNLIGKDKLVLDKTLFYPTGGGQEHDTGTLNDYKVVDVSKSSGVVIHTLDKHKLKAGDKVHGIVDKERRLSLAKNHTAAHIVGGAARQILGPHTWQTGSQIDVDKGRLDISHYKAITAEEVSEIEKLANKVVAENRKTEKGLEDRAEAEKKYGFILYQGGVVPGNQIRVMKIPGLDIQACGGTHLDSTGEVEGVKIIKTEKIQDGVVRLVFVAGKGLLEERRQKEESIEKAVSELVKDFVTGPISESDILESSQILRVQKEQLSKTLLRFLGEVGSMQKELSEEADLGKFKRLRDFTSSVFDDWKRLSKDKAALELRILSEKAEQIATSAGKSKLIAIDEDFGESMKLASLITSNSPELAVLFSGKGRTVLISGRKSGLDSQKALNKLLPKAKISGNPHRAIADKPLKDIKEATKKL
ncbi:TPA: alanine--tRNA ligase [archaeon]|uniref:Alanine--tRNA ligase n=1 Tax=Candidatus Undinarchaeum marinum TaxID=2756141 RepID=A0A832ULP6_9ARCH|nr:alanine--tRNA ligase [Candidatus Undinarchaeum marinum]